MEKMIKHRLFTWFEEVDSPVQPGTTVLAERIAHLGQVVDITNPAYVKRGEDLDAFFTDKEKKAIEKGTYEGENAPAVFAARQGAFGGIPAVTPAEGEHGDVSGMDAATLGEYIREQKLSVPKTVALIPENADEETLQKFEDAENVATDNSPRNGVVDEIDKRRSALATD